MGLRQIQWAQSYLSRYQYLAEAGCYEKLLARYFSVEGFLVALVLPAGRKGKQGQSQSAAGAT